MLILVRTTLFKKKFQALQTKLQEKVEERLRIFMSDPFNPILNNHPLHGEYNGCRSINITGDWRVVYSLSENTKAILLDIGTHNQLYER